MLLKFSEVTIDLPNFVDMSPIFELVQLNK